MPERLATVADLPPEFDDVDSRDLTYWLNVAATSINVAGWGEDASIAHAMLAAHHLKKANKGSDASTGKGPVTSERVGDVAVTYAGSSTEAEGKHGSTTYGQIYDRMCASRFPSFGAIAIRSDEEPHIHR